MSTSDLAISVRGLSKAYVIHHNKVRHNTLAETIFHRLRDPFRRPEQEIFWALKDVSFDVKKGEIVGIIGRNGAGKSTLLKILSRITEPTSGEIDLYGRVGSLLEVGTGFHPELTGRENIFLNGQILGMRRKEIDTYFEAIVDFAEIEKFIDTPVKRYSSGMYVRLAFAVAAHLKPEILIIDEVLAVGDQKFQQKCMGKIGEVAKTGRTILLVSHNMAAVERLCDRALHLANGRSTEMTTAIEAIGKYIGEETVNVRHFSGCPLVIATVKQVGEILQIQATYRLEKPIDVPSLGFVISDMVGNRICGSNPVVSESPGTPRGTMSGCVTASMMEPKLLNGTYRLSLWFGNGSYDLCEMLDCLTFEVVNMASLRQQPISAVGPVEPSCVWHFSDAMEMRS